jgi:hypothetical protein
VNTEFILGEEKWLDFNITSRTSEPFVITASTWQLKDGAEVIDSGSCTIDGSTVSVLLAPEERGRFVLEVSYVIPPETRKARVLINVT